jgi:hypothetical protein
MRAKRRLYSIPKSPVLRAVRSPTSVRLVVSNKINEQLCSFSRQANFNYVTIKYKRVKHWLKRGVSFHPKNLQEVSRVLYPPSLNNTAEVDYDNLNNLPTRIDSITWPVVPLVKETDVSMFVSLLDQDKKNKHKK